MTGQFLGYFLLLLLCVSHVQSQQEGITSLPIEGNSLPANNDVEATCHYYEYRGLKNTHTDSANWHLNRARKLLPQLTSDSLRGKILVALVEKHLLINQYDSVIYFVDKSRNYQKYMESMLQVDLYSMLGTAHCFKSEHAKSLAAHRIAESICRANDYEQGLAKVFNNIGVTYIKMYDWPLAKNYMTLSLKLCQKFNIQRGMAFTLGNLGIINKNQGNIDAAIDAYLKSNELLEEANDIRGLARNYNNLGSLYEQIENYTLAEQYYLKCRKASEQTGDQSTLTSALHNLGSLHSKLNHYNTSIGYYTKSLEIAKNLDSKDVIRENHLGLSRVFEKNEHTARALFHHKLYSDWKDSVINKMHLENISELEIKYESEKKENDILLLTQQKLRTDTQVREQKAKIKQLTFGLLGVILALGIVVLLMLQYQKNRKHRQLIETIAEAQIRERNRIARDLHDGIGGSLAIVKNNLQQVYISNKDRNAEISKAINSLTNTSNQLRQISHNLMPGELMQFGLVSAVKTTLEELKGTNLKVDLYVHNMDERINAIKEIYLFRIIQEAIQNVLKHSKANAMSISLNKHPKYVNLMVEDNGIGIDKEKNSPGIGIENIEARVAQLKGIFNMDSVPGRGTTISIQIPL